MKMNNPVGWFEIYVRDMARACAFYEGMLGVALTPLSDPADGQTQMMAFGMNNGAYGASGALTKMPGFEPAGNAVLVYFSCEDCALTAAKAVQHGGQMVKEKSSIGPYGFIALVHDTEGNLIGLHTR
jgi:uncharacterized protein